MKHPFEYQAPTPVHVAQISKLREATKTLFEEISNVGVPQCAERTLAIRKLEEFSMWINKAIVFDGERYLG